MRSTISFLLIIFVLNTVSTQQSFFIYPVAKKSVTNLEANKIPMSKISRNQNYLLNSRNTPDEKLKFGLASSNDQCSFYEDYSNSIGWTQIGSLVEIKNGELQFINGAPDGWPDGIQRRVYKKLENSLKGSDLWTTSFKFLPKTVGDFGGPFTGHLLLSLTENTQDPWCDCPDLECSGYPIGSQDAISVTYMSPNPPNGNFSFYITVRNNYNRYDSPPLNYNILGEEIYVVLKKNELNYTLNIFSDADHSKPLGNGPVSLNMVCISELNYIQHGNSIVGFYARELTGSIDDVCIEYNGEIEKKVNIEYNGCSGDNYSINVNGNTYNENNPSGTEYMNSSSGCVDSIVNINLVFNPLDTTKIVYEGIQGDGHKVIINGTIYDEFNPFGTEILKNHYGCDSIIYINLSFKPKKTDDCIIFKPDGESGKDALIINAPGKYKLNYGNDPQMTAMAWNNNDHAGQHIIRSLFQFQLDQIPQNAEIISAKLSLFAWDSEEGFKKHDHLFNLYNDFYIRRITENWEENKVTWFDQPASTFENQIYLNRPIYDNQDYLDIDVTQLVKDMFKFPENSFGFLLKLKKEAVFRKINFSSSDHPDPDKWPELEVCYKLKDNTVINNRDFDDNCFDFDIYPNPANSSFSIFLKEKDTNNIELELFNSNSELVYKSNYAISDFNVVNYPKGIYFVKVKNFNYVRIKKLIIQ